MKTLKLTWVLLISSLDLGLMSKSKKIKPQSQLLFAGFLVAIFIGSFSIPVGAITLDIIKILNELEIAELVWYIALPFGSITLAVLSIFTIISVMFLSSDNQRLLYLPLSPRQIISARFLVVLVLTYLIELIFFIPIMVGYGIGTNAGILIYAIIAVVLLLLPIIPLSLIILVLTILLRYTSLNRYRDIFSYAAMGIVLALALGFNYFFTQAITATSIDPAQLIINLRVLIDTYSEIINQFFPYLNFAIIAITNSQIEIALLNFVVFVIINLIVFIGLLALTGPIYLKTIIGSDERRKNKKNNGANFLQKNSNYQNHLKSLIINEWRLMVRSPIYFLNLVFIVVLVPILLVGSILIGGSAGPNQIDLQTIISVLTDLEFNFANPWYFTIIIGIGLFLGGINMISSTAISRMGSSAGFFKALPISPLDLINIKTFWGNLLMVVPTTIYMLIGYFLGAFSLVEAIIFSVAITPIFFILNYLGVFIDLKSPKLDWISESQAVKQNLNAIIYMLLVWAFSGLLIYGGYLIRDFTYPLGGLGLGLTLTIVGLVGNLLIIKYIKNKGVKLFRNIS